MMNWKEIKGYEGLYAVNDQGEVLSQRRPGAQEDRQAWSDSFLGGENERDI